MEWHVTIAAVERRNLVGSEEELRGLVHAVTRVVRLRMFSAVDDHLHLLLEGERYDVGHAVSGIMRSLGSRGMLLEEAHFRRVAGRPHLERLVAYFVRQPFHHGLDTHPAAWSGSSFADHVGARALPSFDAGALFRLLPRWRPADLWRLVELRVPSDVTDEAIRRGGAFALHEEALAAFAAWSSSPRAEPTRRARQAAAALGLHVGISATELAAPLGTEASVVREIAARCPSSGEAVVRARLALIQAARSVPTAGRETLPRAVARWA